MSYELPFLSNTNPAPAPVKYATPVRGSYGASASSDYGAPLRSEYGAPVTYGKLIGNIFL